MGQLILIRHCETGSNAEGMVQGCRDMNLSSRGAFQAQLVADYLRQNFSIRRVISSDRTRCLETANAISKSVISTPLLRELDFGDWEGQKWSKISSDYPEDIECLLSSDPKFAAPGGDSLGSLAERTDRVIVEYDLRSSQDTVAIVSHDGTLRSMIVKTLGWNPQNLGNLTLFVGSISVISLGPRFSYLQMLNHYEHLSSSYQEAPPN